MVASAKQKIDPKSELTRHLLAAQTLHSFESGSNINLFRAFDLTGFSYKGQLTSGYGERGTKVSLDVSWDFGDLILPGLLSAKVEIGASAAKTRYSLLFVARNPKALIFSVQNWSTNRPLCLCIMNGYALEGTARIGASASVGDVDELGFEVSVQANADIKGRVIHLRDEHPRFYPPSAWDDSLVVDFIESLDVLTRHQVKNMIDAWLKEQQGRIEEKDKKKNEDAKKWAEDASKFFEDELDLGEKKKDATAKVKDKIGEGTPEAIKAIEKRWRNKKFTVSLPTWAKKIVVAVRPHKSKDLLSRLDDLEKELPAEDRLSDDDEKRAVKLARLQIKNYRTQIESLQAKKASKKNTVNKKGINDPLPKPLPSMCYLNLFAIDGGGSADAQATLKVEIKQVSAKGKASADYKARANRISYRFQTLASDTKPLVITQDTVVTYREVDANAATELGLTIPKEILNEIPEQDIEAKKDKKKSLSYRTMTYRSAVIYWLCSTNASGSAKVTPGTGSGVSFGCGVNVCRLINAAQQLVWKRDGKSPEIQADSTALLSYIERQLRVPREKIENFLVEAGIEKDQPEQYETDVVLLEAGFALPQNSSDEAKEPFSMTVTQGKKKNGYQLPDLLGKLKSKGKDSITLDGHSLSLNVLRLRYRLSDSRDRAETVFKLGFSYVVGFDFSVDKIKMAGHEGIIDLFTWFTNEEHNENPLEGQEQSVPPVALLHH